LANHVLIRQVLDERVLHPLHILALGLTHFKIAQ